MQVTTLEVRKDDVSEARLVTEDAPELKPGQALFEVERFALSANNVTYGALGDRLGYWRFFPASEDGWGRIPAWGYARAGDLRVFGYVPMASHAVLRLDDRLVETSEHRADLPKAYNVYARDPGGGDAELLLRPLYVLSFLLDDALGDPGRPVIVTSASSKSALGFARLQAERGTRPIGLTSARNREFVERLDVYETVATYDDPPSGDGALLVDIAGSRPIEAEETILVGATHRDDLAGAGGATFFSAPSELRNRRAAVEQRFPRAFTRLVEWSGTWLNVRGGDALEAYRAVAHGEAAPDEGYVVRIDEPA
jgi:Protein of unknown function (DUF2855)